MYGETLPSSNWFDVSNVFLLMVHSSKLCWCRRPPAKHVFHPFSWSLTISMHTQTKSTDAMLLECNRDNGCGALLGIRQLFSS